MVYQGATGSGRRPAEPEGLGLPKARSYPLLHGDTQRMRRFTRLMRATVEVRPGAVLHPQHGTG